MKETYLTVCAMALVIAPSMKAEWELVTDFEGTAGLDAVTFTEYPEEQPDGNGGISLVADPVDSSNQVLALDPGTFPVSGGSSNQPSFFIPFSDITSKGTVYARFGKLGDLVDIVWGTTSTAAPGSYGDFSSAARVEIDSIFDYREGSDGYVEIVGSSSSTDTWYETWFVVDVATNTYDLWINGGVYTTPTKVATGANFRNQSTDPQNRFYARSTTGSTTSPLGMDSVIFDDVWVDTTGENITSPVEGGGGDEPNDLINISTRGLVGLGGEIMIAGFVSAGDAGSGTVLIRGIGPTLGGFGVANTVEDPVITVFRTEADGSSTQIAMNDDWGDSVAIAEASAAVGAFALDAGSADAALLLSGLTPGAYTVQLSGKGTVAQNGLIEIYRVD